MTRKLFWRALSRFIAGMLLVGGLIFLPAGTLYYPDGWRLMGVLFVPMLLLGAVLMVKSPALLEKRLRDKEQRGEQSRVVKLSALMFLTGFVVAGLDFRFGWSALPGWVSSAAAGAFLLSYLLYAEVMRENAYLSRTVEVQQGQTVVDTGLYGVIRHPMYAATILMFCSMPLILESLSAFVIFLTYPAIIVRRIRDEERLLTQELDGYEAYRKKVRYKIIPFLW